MQIFKKVYGLCVNAMPFVGLSVKFGQTPTPPLSIMDIIIWCNKWVRIVKNILDALDVGTF